MINKQKFKLKEIHHTPKISRSTWMSLDIIHFTIMVEIRISITTFQEQEMYMTKTISKRYYSIF